MRLLLLLSTVATAMDLTHGHVRSMRALATADRPKCTASATKMYVDNLSVASGGCTDSLSYVWDGSADPTDEQRAALCKCKVSPFDVPKCYWIKLSETNEQFNVPAGEHFGFAYKCLTINGKSTPAVTEVDLASTPAPSPAGAICTAQQSSSFTSALKTASSGCLDGTSYDWIGSSNPTNAQYSEICKCASVSSFTIPACSVQKGPDTVPLEKHYSWVKTDQCSTFAPSPSSDEKKSSSKVGLIAGIAGGVLVVMLLTVFFLCKRIRKSKQEQYVPHDDMNAMRSPSYQPIGATPPINKTNSDPRPSGTTTATHTTISTANGSVRPSGTGTGSLGTNHSTRSTETGKWDDPVIMMVRIPHDSIFFGTLLSRGGFGEVYRGTYKGETVAIKKLLPDRRKDLRLVDDFLGEVKLMSSLEHERIVKFVGVAWNSLSDVCMVVEFMENGDLRSLLGRWDSGPEQRMNGFDADKVKIALHIAHALVYLHSLQPVVVHRDLKSKNILLDANLDAKLTDFGISRERADATMTAGVGSALWMAPEIMMGSRYDEKADIFSFGVVLSELDTHQLPYFHATMGESGQKMPEAAKLQQVMLGRLSVGFTDRADPELVQLGRECVNLDPKARPTTAQVLHRVHQAMRKYQ